MYVRPRKAVNSIVNHEKVSAGEKYMQVSLLHLGHESQSSTKFSLPNNAVYPEENL